MYDKNKNFQHFCANVFENRWTFFQYERATTYSADIYNILSSKLALAQASLWEHLTDMTKPESKKK